MERAVVLIGVYRTCFYVCLALMLLGLASAAILFFRFDVRQIFMIRTGRAARQTIRKIAETNARTGRLQPGEDMDFTTGGLSGGGATAPLEHTPPTEPAAPPPNPPPPPPPPPPPALRAGLRVEVTQAVLLVHTQERI